MSRREQQTRELSDYLAIFRRHWLLSAIVAIITTGATGVYTLGQPTLYRSSMKIVIGQQGGAFQLNVGNIADEFTQTMKDLLASDVVARSVIGEMGLTITPADLLAHLDVVTKPSTSVLLVTYDDTDPARGQAVLSAVGGVFTELVAQRLATVPDRSGGSSLSVSATVFDPAHRVPGAVQPKPLRNLAVALLLGVVLGLVAALVREQLDDTVRSVEQAEEAFGQTTTVVLPPGVVGYMPFDRAQSGRHDPLATELAMQKLRASIEWSPDAAGSRTLLVTSGGPEEGKSTIAANLALIMAMEGRSVIVVEGDLHRPSLHRFLGMPLDPRAGGLDLVMRGKRDPEQALVEVPVPPRLFASFDGMDPDTWDEPLAGQPTGRLRAILAPTTPGQLSEFSLSRTTEVISRLRGLADFVIVDAPPILVVPDAYPFAATVDTVIAVVRKGRTATKAASLLGRTLERLRARRVDLVVSDAEPGFARTYYGYRASGNRPGASPANGGGQGNGAASRNGRAGRPALSTAGVAGPSSGSRAGWTAQR